MSARVPSSVTVWPFTWTRPSRMMASAARRLAMPARARIFCRRSPVGASLGVQFDFHLFIIACLGDGGCGASPPLFLCVERDVVGLRDLLQDLVVLVEDWLIDLGGLLDVGIGRGFFALELLQAVRLFPGHGLQIGACRSPGRRAARAGRSPSSAPWRVSDSG